MNTPTKYTNRLATESSPYLLMHAHNPVDWFPWGEEAFAKAKAENKLVIVSIGYAACHWCHVMEHESFSDADVAELMNQHFISVKVDREERPDVDDIYMNAVQIISGQGGWPLNAIILPNGKPVYAVTYLPSDNWKYLLNQIQQLHETSSEKLVEQAQEVTKRIQQLNAHYVNASGQVNFNTETDFALFQNLINVVDFTDGGLNSAPKFPMPVVFEYLLHYSHTYKETRALEAVTLTLDKMAMGGIYDQIGGGFARYSTDNYWKVPHFEKMLYDNAQLVSLYANAYKLTRHERYASVIKETIQFVQRELTSGEYGFYSAIDADSEGVEGKFYVWDCSELRNILNDDELFVLAYYSVKEKGNWEDSQNILFRSQSDDDFMRNIGASSEGFYRALVEIKKKLLGQRNKRIRPLTDTKIITSWNALMIKGYLEAYAALGEVQYLTRAIENAQFILQKLLTDEVVLFRNYKDGKRYNNAKLDDYANTISAFIALYQTTFDEQWLKRAKDLTEHTLQHFFDAQTGMFFYTSDLDEVLITRQFEIPDNVIPSSNSVMALNLFYLGYIYSETTFISKSEKMLANVQVGMTESAAYFANWAKLQLLLANSPYEVAIVGDNYQEVNTDLHKYYIPHVVVTGCKHTSNLPQLQHKFIENQTSIYICKDKVCGLPITDLKEVLDYLGYK